MNYIMRYFLMGNEILARAAYEAGAQAMFSYPITPVTEVFATWVKLIQGTKRHSLQTEDEMAAGFGVCGANLAGARAFTATAGPGMVLMQDPLSMAEAMRLPMVVFDGQRGGPSSGQVIYSQQEVNLATFGGNGEGLRIVYSTSSLQDLYNYGKKVFTVAWRYRFPTILLYDGYQGKMKGEVDLPRVKVKKVSEKPILVTNMRNTYNMEEELGAVVSQNNLDFQKVVSKIVEFEEKDTEGAKIVIFAHGIVAAAVKIALKQLATKGIKVGLFRPITLSPFPNKKAREVARKSPKIMIFESSLGQFSKLVKNALYGLETPIVEIKKPGIGFTPEEITQKTISYLKP